MFFSRINLTFCKHDVYASCLMMHRNLKLIQSVTLLESSFCFGCILAFNFMEDPLSFSFIWDYVSPYHDGKLNISRLFNAVGFIRRIIFILFLISFGFSPFITGFTTTWFISLLWRIWIPHVFQPFTTRVDQSLLKTDYSSSDVRIIIRNRS